MGSKADKMAHRGYLFPRTTQKLELHVLLADSCRTRVKGSDLNLWKIETSGLGLTSLHLEAKSMSSKC